MSRPTGLPDFKKPPLVEVVLGLQFEPIQRFSSVNYRAFQSAFEDQFPNWEEKHPLRPSFEVPRAPSAAAFKIDVQHDVFTLPRLWLSNSDKSRLIQLQSDRFIMNWRSFEGDGVYPRYEVIRGYFAEAAKKFEDVASNEKLGKIELNQIELTYINHLRPIGDNDPWASAQSYINIYGADEWQDNDAEIEDVQFSIRHRLLNPSGEWLGRMLVNVSPALLSDGTKVLALSLTVRGKPTKPGIDGALEFMDWARTKIVNHFTAITTDQLHKIWERTG